MSEARHEGAIVNPRAWLLGRPPTRDEIVAELTRELQMRRSVFPRWVEAGKITQKQSDERTDRLQAVLDYVIENWPRSQQDLKL